MKPRALAGELQSAAPLSPDATKAVIPCAAAWAYRSPQKVTVVEPSAASQLP